MWHEMCIIDVTLVTRIIRDSNACFESRWTGLVRVATKILRRFGGVLFKAFIIDWAYV